MDEQIKSKYSLDRVAFLAIFAVSLLIAYVISVSRSVIELSGPITLAYSGVSVRLPKGNGWHAEESWYYEKNAFFVSSRFLAESEQMAVRVFCRYALATSDSSSDERIALRASAIGGTITESDQIITESVSIVWAVIETEEPSLELFVGDEVFFATCRLPMGRQLDIEVFPSLGDRAMAREVFESIIEKVEFEDNQLIQGGMDIIADIKNRGLTYFAENTEQPTFFLVSDTRNLVRGFLMNTLTYTNQSTELNMQAASILYIKSGFAREQVSYFQGNETFDDFSWKSESSSRLGKSGAEIIKDDSGTISVIKYGRRGGQSSYPLSPVAIPMILLGPLLKQMSQTGHGEVLVDIVTAEAAIVPGVISRVENQPENGYKLTLAFPDESVLYVPTTMENVLSLFPERSDYILEKSKKL